MFSLPIQRNLQFLRMGIYACLLALLTQLSLTGQETTTEADSTENNLDNYLLAPFDKIAITVFDEPDLETVQRITSRGEVTLPLLGTVPLGGLSVEEAKDKLEQEFISQEYLRQPEVFLAIEEFSPKRITVLGEVDEPSSFSLPMGANFLEIEAAIAMAGGFTDIAKKSAVRVTRRVGGDGQGKVTVIDMDDVLTDEEGGFATTRFKVLPGDILYIPRRYF